MTQFKDKTVLVTGGGSGIGLAFAKALAAEGARLALVGTNAEKLEAAKALVGGLGAQVATARLDVADEAAWPGAVAALEATLGPVDSLFLNAGVGPAAGPVETIATNQWEWSWNVNVMGVVHGLQTCLPGMKARGVEGHVMLTSSISGVWPRAMMGPYAIAKAAVVMLAETLRLEFEGSALSASVLCPAAVRTDLAETSRLKAPADADTSGYGRIAAMLAEGMDPDVVARFSLDRIREGRFYIFTHPQNRDVIGARYAELMDEMRPFP